MGNINKVEVDKFLLKVKNGDISKLYKNILYNLVMDMKEKTIKQKNRFVLYYNIIPNQDITYSMADLARLQGCSSSAVRYSILTIRHALINHKKEEFIEIIKKNR